MTHMTSSLSSHFHAVLEANIGKLLMAETSEEVAQQA